MAPSRGIRHGGPPAPAGFSALRSKTKSAPWACHGWPEFVRAGTFDLPALPDVARSEPMFYADLHVHSKYSRACSRDCDLEHLAWWAARKGIRVVGTGDFCHPAWAAELREKLEPAEPGLFRLRPDLAERVDRTLPPHCRIDLRFMLSVEISTIYKRDDRTRKVHHLLYAPDMDAAGRITAALDRIGNITSDGRPILGLDSRDLLDITLASDPGSYLVPAHVWTPWFSAMGSKSGFDRVADCYADLAGHIFAAETGLSSDPPMNWRVGSLDEYTLVSNSDAHSPPALGREATTFGCAVDYFAIRRALETGEAFGGTVEFFPEEGKYHMDGHRKCGVRLEPAETPADGRCPACGRPLTIGVLHRVDALADHPEGRRPRRAAPFRSLIPLPEMISEILGVGPKSKKVAGQVTDLVARLGPELSILTEIPVDEVAAAGGTLLGEAISRLRRGEVIREGGYDGEYGVIRVFSPDELYRSRALPALFDVAMTDEATRPAGRAPATAPGRGTTEAGDGGAPSAAAGEPIPGEIGNQETGALVSAPGGGARARTGYATGAGGGGGTGEFDEAMFAELGPPRPGAALAAGEPAAEPEPERVVRAAEPLATDVPGQMAIEDVTGVPPASTPTPPEGPSETTDSSGPEPDAGRGGGPVSRAGGGDGDWLGGSLLDGLDAAQREAAAADGRPLLIIAGPGTGKTRTLTYRIAVAVRERGVAAERCLAITFTRRAAEEMRERLVRLLPDAGPRPTVTTFHGLGAAILREHPESAGLTAAFRVADERDRLAVATELAGTERDARRMLAALDDDPDLRERFEKALRARDLADFDDLIRLPVRLLREDPATAARLRDRWRHISVDEYQDVDATQYELLKLLAGDGAELTAIGDPDQAIYAFRGADVRFFLRFREDYPDASVVALGRNYRSSETIVAAAGHAVAPDTLVAGRELTAVRTDLEATPVAVYGAADPDGEAAFIVGAIEGLLGGSSFHALDSGRATAEGHGGVAFADIAVLYRTDAQAEAIMSALTHAGMPFQKRTHDRLVARPGVPEIAAELPHHRAGALADRIRTAAAAVAGRRADDDLATVTAATELLMPLAERSAGDLDRFLTELALGAEVDAYDPRAQAITLLTLHAAKGLEFPVVFLAGCERDMLPFRPAYAAGGLDAREIAEERRLFFVGITRAQERLYLSYAAERPRQGNVRATGPSPFLDAIPAALTERLDAGSPRRRPRDRQLRLL